jgi:hypothetical protein
LHDQRRKFATLVTPQIQDDATLPDFRSAMRAPPAPSITAWTTRFSLSNCPGLFLALFGNARRNIRNLIARCRI